MRVPTTEETLELARDSGIPMCFEVKGAGPEEANRIARWLVDLFVRHDALGWAVMAGYDHGALARAKARVPELILAPDRLPDNIAADPPEALRQARHLGAPVIMSHYRFLTAELVNHLHDGGVAVWSWPTTEEQSIVDSIKVGADGVIGDDVRAMIRAVGRP